MRSGSHAGTVTASTPSGRSTQLADRGDVVGDVLQHLAGDDAVERGVRERQLRRIP